MCDSGQAGRTDRSKLLLFRSFALVYFIFRKRQRLGLEQLCFSVCDARFSTDSPALLCFQVAEQSQEMKGEYFSTFMNDVNSYVKDLTKSSLPQDVLGGILALSAFTSDLAFVPFGFLGVPFCIYFALPLSKFDYNNWGKFTRGHTNAFPAIRPVRPFLWSVRGLWPTSAQRASFHHVLAACVPEFSPTLLI